MKHRTIRRYRDFYSPSNGLKMRSECFILKVKKQSVPGETRYGLIAAKRSFKTAVARNRAKRRMRVWLAEYEDLMILEMDYIFILHPKILDYPTELGLRDTRKAIQRINALYCEDFLNVKQISE